MPTKKKAPKIKVFHKDLSDLKRLGQAWQEARIIDVDADAHQKAKDLLDTYIHEVIHVALPTLEEEKVDRLAGEITEVLWGRGYRQVKLR